MRPSNEKHSVVSLAIRSPQLLGVVSSLFGLVVIVAFGYLNPYQRFGPYFITLGLLVWFAPGVIFIACAYLLRRRRRVGATLGIMTALFQTLCAAAILLGTCTLPPVSPIPIVMSVLWLAALGQLMLHLQRSLRTIRADTMAM